MIRLLLVLAALWISSAHAADTSPTLAAIRARGSVVCGVQAENPPFSLPDSQGVWRGLDIDSCRALAAAILDDPAKITIRPVTGLTRFPAIQGGEVDVLFGSTTWLTTRESSLGLQFAAANYYSGQGFMVRASLGVTTIAGLDGASICVPPGSSTELILQDWFRKNGKTFRPVIIDDPSQIQSTFLSGRCDAYTRDMTGLSGFRKGDDAWFDVVRWTALSLVWAEQLGVTQATVDTPSTSPDIRRLLGTEGNIGATLGLGPKWAANAIRAVGNYGEMWQRDVAPMGLARGLNNLWDKGGLMFSPPLR
jgi:general L-amino acid transport system substrate-binding protein